MTGLCGRRRGGFTLTELLVVIAIIGVLASLITAAAVNALKNAKRARIVLEIKNMSGAIENFKTDYGAYPPNGRTFPGNTNVAAAPIPVAKGFERVARKAFPRIHRDEIEVLKALVNAPHDTAVVPNATITNGMTPQEALCFWLGGFSADPQFPLSGPGGPSHIQGQSEILEDRAKRFEFDLGRLAPRDDDGKFYSVDNGGDGRYLVYSIDMNGNGNRNDAGEVRRIHLWRFLPAGSEQPYAYFDCSQYKPYLYDMSAFDASPYVFPLLQLRSGAGAVGSDPKNLVFVNQGKFQILHPGLDDVWGQQLDSTGVSPSVTQDDADSLTLFPDGPFTGEAADTLSNITDGELSDSQDK